MKKSILIMNLILMTVIGISTQSCKKGENDPFLSFRSRDGRLTRTWLLSSIDETRTVTNKNASGTITVVTKTTYSDKMEKMQVDAFPAIETFYTLEITFDKRGIFTYVYETFDNKDKSTGKWEGEGRWGWISTDKRKSAVMMSAEEPGVEAIIGGNWDVDQLKKKELILKHSYHKMNSNLNTSMDENLESLYTFEEN